MTMKYIKSKLAVWSLVLSMLIPTFVSCVDDFAVGDSFLDKQPGVDVTLDTISRKPSMHGCFFGIATNISITDYPDVLFITL